MAQRRERMVLGAYLSYGTGHHAASWRHPTTSVDSTRSFRHHVRMIETAEHYGFDLMFLSDAPAVFNDDRGGRGGRVASFEPMTLMSALATHSHDIGLVVTSSTTYKEPYNVAREYASLDLISGGRACWNLVTTSKLAAARNFGLPAHPEHAYRYSRAEEFVDVVRELWDTWEDDAFESDKSSGFFYDPRKRHPVRFRGSVFDLDAELNVPRPPQGHPILVQAGASHAGRQLAARTADIVFTAQTDIESAVAFTADIDERASGFERNDSAVIVLPGLTTYLGKTDAEACEKVAELQALIEPEFGISMLSDLVGGFDLSGCDPEGPLPVLPASNANTSRRKLIEHLAYERGWNIRKLYEHMTTSRGHLTLVGSYDHVADEIERWFVRGAADGFNVMPPLLPDGLSEFGEHVVGRLERRGLFDAEYGPGTLREKLGLQRPVGKRVHAEA
ncbi:MULTISPECIES: LLM class flavin-dependent oxidoreductase [unclassified Rhodococcus (in: high G+C Gram-positive bacteria)]|uniref:LLM class flavin-dependent oxidoreductase n=1 Tax=unclassified Rhodococcus (in: high G+C Gram-positive bacteria) TaxID=192944 RepID=UPI0016054739|nr:MULTISPECIES: LLM class flavin-dependent oxidoreductase [unclassified Rhodococcus (in: high G+C Gram-positive bacteria)]